MPKAPVRAGPQKSHPAAASTLAGASEQVSIAQAQLDSAEADLAKTVIYSPLDGTISQLNSQLGERVGGTATMTGTPGCGWSAPWRGHTAAVA